MSSQYYSNLLDTYRRRVNNDKGMFHIRNAVHETNRIEEFRSREKIRQEMARQRRLQIESDKRFKYRMQEIREQERAIANRYAHIKNPTLQRYGKTEKSRLGVNQSEKKRNIQQHRYNQYKKSGVGKMPEKMQEPKVTYLPSLNISKVTSKTSSTDVGKSSKYQGQTSIRASEKESFDINLRFTRNVMQESQEMQNTNLDSKPFAESNSYYNPSVISHTHNESHRYLNKEDEHIVYNNIANATGQNYLVQASLEDPHWYQHIFVKNTNNGPMYFASDYYCYHPGGEQLEAVYLVDTGPLSQINPDFQHLPGHSNYEQKSQECLEVDYIHAQHNNVPHHLPYQNQYPESEYSGNYNTSQNLKSQFYSEPLSGKKYEMLVLNQDDKRAEQIRVKQASMRDPFNTYDILSIERVQGKSRPPSVR